MLDKDIILFMSLGVRSLLLKISSKKNNKCKHENKKKNSQGHLGSACRLKAKAKLKS